MEQGLVQESGRESLPKNNRSCGTKVHLRYRGNSVKVPVIDRGPYAGGREYDLTAATKEALGFPDVGNVLTTR